MNPDTCLQLHTLRREVLSSRTRGRVVIEFADGAEIEEPAQARFLADGMLSLVNFPPLGRHWNEANRERAASIISAVLHLDLERRTPLGKTSRATDMAMRILSNFGEGTTFLTNVRANADLSQPPHRWASGSDTTELDAGVVMVSPQIIGLLWVEDRP